MKKLFVKLVPIWIFTLCSVLNIFAQELKYFDFGYSSSLSDIDDVMNELKLPNTYTTQLNSVEEDSLNNARHEEYNLYYNGIRIDYTQLMLHYRNDSLLSSNGKYVDIATADVVPTITSQQAIDYAKNEVRAIMYLWEDSASMTFLQQYSGINNFYPTPELILFPINDSVLKIGYKMEIVATNPSSEDLFIVDAKTGDILYTESLICSISGTAETRYSGTQTISTKESDGNYKLLENSDRVNILTINMNRKTDLSQSSLFADNDNDWTSLEYHNSNMDDAALDAHWGAEMVYDYFFNIHGRNSYNNNGGSLINFVHYNDTMDNAYWYMNHMEYGDGGSRYKILTSLDVVSHEISHGVCQYSADLQYWGESGAINESLSDIYAACVQNYANVGKNIWLIGDEICRNDIAMRSMNNPKLLEDPDTYLMTYWKNTSNPSRENDNGGVHTNSGVMNYWFYLLCEGGAGINDYNYHYNVDGIGMGKAERIVYLMETGHYLTKTSTFYEARQASINAAIFLYGVCSKEVSTVIQAWNAVGVVKAYKEISLGSNYYTGTLTANTTINSLTYGIGDIVVGNGRTLTITSILKLAPATRIIIKRGGKLVVNGGTITSACDEAWGGIVLGGNNNLPQTTSNQGVVELTNATIENGNVSISTMLPSDWNTTGGIIKATNTTFRNNNKSIEFLAYNYYDSTTNEYLDNVSYFRNCTFTWNDNMLPLQSGHNYMGVHITMYQVRGVEISGCTFKDERTNIPSSTHGLLTLESGFNVDSYNTATASFEDLTFGIKTDNSGTRICSIENAEFTDNYCGINATTSNNLVITNNSFNISPKTFTVGGISNLHVEAEALGAFVETSSLPTIENNAFVGTGKTYSLVGLQVKNLGTNNTIINNNSFSGLYAGTQALGYNRGVTQGFIIKGLQYKCNSFLNCSKGIFVTSYGESLSNLFSGIHPNQGSSTQINNNFFALNNDNDIYNLVPYTLTYYYYRISPRNCVGITLTSTTTPGTPCGTIGVTEPTDLLTNNTLGANVLSLIDEENNIDNVGNKTIFDTINEYIEDGQYNTAKTRLQNMEITSENRNEVEDYISYINKIEEYGNSYKIPDNDLIELSTHTTQVGKRASAMVYFKNINREYLPRVVREDEETSSDSSMQNKIQEQIIEKGIEITEEYILTPNPANNEVEIKTTNRGKTTEQHIIPAENTIRQVVILDLQGKELKTFDNTTTFNIAFLKNGTYILKIKDSENKLHYQKLIKR